MISNSATAPYSNTGGKSQDNQTAKIDWFAFTVRSPRDATEYQGELLNKIKHLFNLPEQNYEIANKGWYGYTYRVDLGRYGLMAWGGESQDGTYHIEINAHGCDLVNDWKAVMDFGIETGAKITRIDLAHDDYGGETVNIARSIEWYDAGLFTSSGRPPKRSLIDDFNSGAGKTLYVGDRKSGKLCRVYEKGKQLGDKLSSWVRFEVELRNKSRVIPWDICVNASEYLAGSYPCAKLLHFIQKKIATTIKTAQISYQKMVGWLREAAGKSISTMLEVNGGDIEAILAQIVRPGRPRRLRDLDLGGMDNYSFSAV